ncbi:MAG: NCS2 family permease [Bryobacteraceae bacterium]|nr:NCS2 family permease [Bryobacteraceae bacterium]
MRRMRQRLERYFEFERLGTTWRTEIVAGFTTFLTMAYIIFVNPSILKDAGMPFTAVVAATCVSAAFGSILMGVYARYPIALAPGMGLNAYFAYAVVKGMGVSWQVALGAVFLSGVAFLLLTFAGLRELILYSIPAELYAAVAVGIGLFIAFIGLSNASVVVKHPATLVAMGDLRHPMTLLALAGLLFIAVLLARGVRAAMLIGILATAGAGALLGLIPWEAGTYSLADITETAFRMDIRGALRLDILEITLVFLFINLFDDIGTLVGVGKKANLFDASNRIPRVNRILFTNASATVAGATAGTSTVVSYIESAAGVAAGGRTGVPAIVSGLLFLAALFVAPLAGAIPSAATAPALILVGSLMISHAAEIDWNKPAISIPAFLTMITIPLTFSIANGLAFGFTIHTLIRILRGEARRVSWLVYVLTALFLARFFWLGTE